METKEKIREIEEIVQQELSCSAHSLDHSMRVYRLCRLIADKKSVDMETLEIAALMHDIGQSKEASDSSGKTDHAIEGAKMAGDILRDLHFPEDKIKNIQNCIISHRYRTKNRPKTEEAKILFDADKLDGIGALGIARMFAWVGKNGANIYRRVDLEEYAKENLTGGDINGRIKDRTKHSPQIEFEIKAGRLKDRLYTKEAKSIFDERVEYMRKFLERLENEVEGKI